MRPSTRLSLRFAAVALAAWVAAMDAASAQDNARKYQIAEQPLAQALREFALASNLDLLFSPDLVAGKKSPSLDGKFTVDEGLRTLLRGSGLEFSLSGSRVVISETKSGPARQAIAPTTSATNGTNGYTRLAQADDRAASDVRPEQQPAERVELEEIVVTIPEVLVVGSKILNMDIRRTEDDAQPYVIFEREVIAESGVGNLNDFLKQRLTMNTVGRTFGQDLSAVEANRSQINLRGLGANNTLILVDGRRIGSERVNSSPLQSDINSIPLAAIERIEVLPATASGIYGGNATGGVINIILRRDYEGLESKLTYDNTFDGDSAMRRVDLSAGFALEGGKTTVLLTGSYSDADALLVRERDFFQRGRAATVANAPANLLPPNIPPVGATANIRSVNGSPLFGPGTPNFTSIPVGYAGGGGLAPLQVNAGQYNLDLDRSSARVAILNAPTIESLSANIRRQFTPSIQAFLEVSGSNNLGYSPRASSNTFVIAANAPNNPFGQAIQVTTSLPLHDGVAFSSSRKRSALGGMIFRLPGEWVAELDYQWFQSTSEFSSPVAPFALPSSMASAISSGSVDILRDTNAFPLDLSSFSLPQNVLSPRRTKSRDATVLVGGPVGSLPGGAPTVNIKVEHREESFGEAIQRSDPPVPQQQPFVLPSSSQVAKSAYMEIRVPLVSSTNSARGLQELDLQLAGRHDEYEVNAASSAVALNSTTPAIRAASKHSSTNPTIGVRYKPLQDVMLRASYGTGFLPPSVAQAVPTAPNNAASGANLIDPQRGNTPVGGTITTTSDLNVSLEPEESESWSAGIVLTPRFASGLRLSVDYTRIEKTDNISQFPGSFQGIINSEALFPDRIVRGQNLPGDPPDWAGRITTIHGGLFNLAKAEVEAYDVQLDYDVDTSSAGTFSLFTVATWQTHFRTQVLDGQPIIENVGVTSSNPLEFKANAGVTWSHGRWKLGWTSEYFDSYIVSTSPSVVTLQGNGGRVPSQIYHDVFASYGIARDKSQQGSRLETLFSEIELQVGARNVFDTKPPLDVGSGTFSYSPFGDPRLATYWLSLKTSF